MKTTCKQDRGTCSNQFGIGIFTGCSSTANCEFKSDFDSKAFLKKFREELGITRESLEKITQDETFDQDDIFEIINQVDHLRDTLKEITKC